MRNITKGPTLKSVESSFELAALSLISFINIFTVSNISMFCASPAESDELITLKLRLSVGAVAVTDELSQP